MSVADRVRALDRFMDCPDAGETEDVAMAVEALEAELAGRCQNCRIRPINNALDTVRETGKCINCGHPWKEKAISFKTVVG